MKAKSKLDDPVGNADAPLPFVLSRKVMVLANLLKRAAGIRYRRLLGLTTGEWGVIAQLGERAPRTLNGLAAGMGLDNTQISRSVSNLVERGLVTRTPNPHNNREILIDLSPEGQVANATIRKMGAAVNNTLLKGLTPAERATLAEQLDDFTESAERLLSIEQATSATTPREQIG